MFLFQNSWINYTDFLDELHDDIFTYLQTGKIFSVMIKVQIEGIREKSRKRETRKNEEYDIKEENLNESRP